MEKKDIININDEDGDDDKRLDLTGWSHSLR